MRRAIALAILVLLVGPRVAAAQDDYTLLKVFEYSPGIDPYPTRLRKGWDGNFYGASGYGPFKVTPDGVYSELDLLFVPEMEIDGGDGYFYRGNSQQVLRFNADGTAITLHEFADPSIGGLISQLVQGNDGHFYGIVGYEWDDRLPSRLFRLTKAGVFSVLHTFPFADGHVTYLLAARDGSIYGATKLRLFRAVNGVVSTAAPFYGFGFPTPYLTEGSDGSIYGVTSGTGFPDYSAGIVYKLPPGENTFTLWPLPALTTEADQLSGPLLEGSDGNFYGTTDHAIFSITPAGVVRVLHNTRRSVPEDYLGGDRLGTHFSGVLEGTDGNLYGTALKSGPGGFGAVFRLNRQRSPCVSTMRPRWYHSEEQRLLLEGTVKTETPAFYASWLFTPGGVTPLWAAVTPAIDPSFYFVVRVPVPESTPVGVLTLLVTSNMNVCSDWQTGVASPTGLSTIRR